MQAHILAHFIEEDDFDKPDFPFLAMTISGGHTQIVKVKSYFDMEVIGETIDDAVGEAYDKSGKTLGLGYPAGPEIAGRPAPRSCRALCRPSPGQRCSWHCRARSGYRP